MLKDVIVVSGYSKFAKKRVSFGCSNDKEADSVVRAYRERGHTDIRRTVEQREVNPGQFARLVGE